MRKLILLISVVVLVGAIGLSVFLFKTKSNIPQNESLMEKNEINEELATEETETNELDETVKQEITSSETKQAEESKPPAITKSETPSPKQESNTSNIPKTEPKKEETIPPKVEEPKVEQDAEYLRLLSQVQYKTYEECMKAGFAIAEKDTVNIAGFSCPYIVYKGQILGYRLEITYY